MKRFWLCLVCVLALSTICISGARSASFIKNHPKSGENEVIQTILERRSVRQYADRPVERAKLEQIVLCGIAAPSPKNSQPWQIRVVTDPAFLDGLTREFLDAHRGAAREQAFKNIFRNAPAVIFIAAPINGSGNLACGMLGENMMLAAKSLGLGSCALGGPVQFMKTYPGARPYLEKLALPANYELLYAIGIGYGTESPAAKSRDLGKVQFIP